MAFFKNLANKRMLSEKGKNTDSDILTYRPFAPAAQGGLYNKWRRDAWYCAHATFDGYDDVYLPYVSVRSKSDPESVQVAYLGGEPVGIIELDLKRCARDKGGWISFLYLTEENRGKGYGRLLIDKASEICRLKGMKYIALCAAEDNLSALGFYAHLGFEKYSEDDGALGKLFLLRRGI